MKILIKGDKGLKFDDKDVEMTKALTPLTQALTPLILGAMGIGLVGLLAWKGHHLAAISALAGTILRFAWLWSR